MRSRSLSSLRMTGQAGLLALIFAGGGSSTPQRAPVPFIDAHIHLNEPDSAMALVNRSGLTGAIIFIGAQGTNDDVARIARSSSGRLVPFASISPERREYRARWMSGDTTLVTELDRMLDAGTFRGIGEISVVHFGDDGSAASPPPGAARGRATRTQARSRDSANASRATSPSPTSGGFPENDFDPTGPVMRGIMRVADRRKLPVLIHCEITRLREFETLLGEFPNVTVIWAHGGYTPLVLAARMLDAHPNLIYELSARTWSSHPRSPDYTIFRNDSLVWPAWLALIERHSTRVVVGTDAPLRSMENDRRKVDRVRILLEQLSDSTRRRVATENLRRVLGPIG